MDNQYGYIPIENAHMLTEVYSIASPATWRFTKEDKEFGGVEENEFTETQKTEIIDLGGECFSSSSEFMNWLNNTTS